MSSSRKQMVCDCRNPQTCKVKYHLTETARGELLPSALDELQGRLIEAAGAAERVQRLLPVKRSRFVPISINLPSIADLVIGALATPEGRRVIVKTVQVATKNGEI